MTRAAYQLQSATCALLIACAPPVEPSRAHSAETGAVFALLSEPAYMLRVQRDEPIGRIGAIAAADGRILVLDRSLRAVWVFDSNGRYLFRFGRSGQGPGEFTRPTAIAVGGDGEIVVVDDRRLHWFQRDGTAIRSVITESAIASVYFDHQSNVWRAAARSVLPLPDGGFEYSYEAGRLARDGNLVAALRVPEYARRPMIATRTAQATVRYPLPYSPAPVWSLGPADTLLSAGSDRYELDLLSARMGSRRIALNRKPVKVRDYERAWVRSVIERRGKAGSANWVWRGPDIPVHKAPVVNIVTSESGEFWVVRELDAVEGNCEEATKVTSSEPDERGASRPFCWREVYAFDVLSADGTYLGEVASASGITMNPYIQPAIAKDALVVVHEDAGGEQSVRVYAFGAESVLEQ